MQFFKTLIPIRMAAAAVLFFFLLTGFLVPALASNAKDLSFKDNWQQKLEKLNLQFATALEKGDVQGMVQYYAADAVSMPEYHSTLSDPEAIAGYYQRWLLATRDNRYKRNIYSIKILEGYLLEAGTFTHDFVQTGRPSFHYSGKYMHVWRVGKKQQLTLVSEIWGAATGLDRASLPLLVYDGNAVQVSPVKTGKSVLTDSVHYYNLQIARLVKERNGAAFSEFYTDDAIYMPYYTPMVIGKDSIHSYYVKHEDPAVAIDSVQINMSRLLAAGDYALVNGFYRVNWRAGDNSGLVTGKSINIWKKEQDGKLRLYWQMTNHD